MSHHAKGCYCTIVRQGKDTVHIGFHFFLRFTELNYYYLFLLKRGIGGTAFYCADRNISLQMKIKTDMAQRCLNSIPMTLHRPLQQLLGDQVEHKHKMKKSLAGYSSKDRLDYIKLGFDDTFEQKLRANYKSSLSTVLLRA